MYDRATILTERIDRVSAFQQSYQNYKRENACLGIILPTLRLVIKSHPR